MLCPWGCPADLVPWAGIRCTVAVKVESEPTDLR
jgi:hypothetical protein